MAHFPSMQSGESKPMWRWIRALVQDNGARGVKPWHTRRAAKQIRWTNYLGMTFVAVSVPSLLLFLATPVVALVLAVGCLGYAAPLFLNTWGYYRLARVAPLAAANMVILLLAQLLGPQSNVQLCLFLAAALPFILFDIRDLRWVMLLETIPVAFFLLLTSGGLNWLPRVSLPEPIASIFSYVAVLSAFAPLSLVLAFFYEDNQSNEDALVKTVRDLQAHIEERRTFEEKLSAAKDAAEAGSRAKAEFLAVMSHEIRTPMNGVIGMTSLLAETPLDADQREMLRIINSSGDFLLSLIDDILDFSKVEAGQLPLQEAKFDVVDLIENAIFPLAPRASAKGFDVGLSISCTVPRHAIGDAGRLRQIVTNLVGNAIKFTDRGFVWVRASAVRDDEDHIFLCCEVQDSGAGVKESDIERIFEPFVQSDLSSTRRHGGTGLGLAICRELVAQMRGTLSVQSTLGAGSLFSFKARLQGQVAVPERRFNNIAVTVLAKNEVFAEATRSLCNELGAQTGVITSTQQIPSSFKGVLIVESGLAAPALWQPRQVGGLDLSPSQIIGVRCGGHACPDAIHSVAMVGRQRDFVDAIAKAASGLRGILPDTKPSASAVLPAQESAGMGLHVLVVEDNVVNQRVLCSMLKKLGCTFAVAVDGQQAITKLPTEPFSLLFMDMQMPVMDGLEAMRIIRSRSDALASIPMICISANASDSDRKSALRAGANSFLTKPVHYAALQETIEGLGLGVPASAFSISTTAE